MGKIEKKIAYMMLFLLVLKTTLTYSVYLELPLVLSNIIELITYVYILINLISIKSVKKSKLLIFVLASVLTFFTGILSGSFVIFSSFLVLTLVCFLDKENVIRVICYTIFSVLVVHFIIYAIDYSMGNITIKIDQSLRIRHTLGFTHANVSGIYALWLYAGYAYLHRNKIVNVCCGEIFILLLYKFNQSRTMFYCSIILVLLFIIANFKVFDKLIKYMCKYIIWVIMIFTIVMIPLFNRENKIAIKIDSITSGRISYIAKSVNTFGYTLIGQEANEKEAEIIMDVTYAAIIYKYGIIYVFLLFILSSYISKHSSSYEQLLVVLWSVFAFFEIYSLNFIIAFPLLFASEWLKEEELSDT